MGMNANVPTVASAIEISPRVYENTKATREGNRKATEEGWFAPAEECAARKRYPFAGIFLTRRYASLSRYRCVIFSTARRYPRVKEEKVRRKHRAEPPDNDSSSRAAPLCRARDETSTHRMYFFKEAFSPLRDQ